MKRLLSLVIFSITLVNVGQSQNIEAHYKVIHSGEIPLDNGETKSYTLDYEGLLYHSDTRTISFLKPLYLLNYPDGIIAINTSYGVSAQGLNMDSIQSATLYKTDTSIAWYSRPKKLFQMKVKKEFPSYKYFDDTKTINGLLCKHAFCYYPSSDKPWADIWYYPDYKLPYSFFGIGNMPGLLVQGDFFDLNYTFTLMSLKTNEPIDESVFMPKYFEEPAGKDLKKESKLKSKNADIMNQ